LVQPLLQLVQDRLCLRLPQPPPVLFPLLPLLLQLLLPQGPCRGREQRR